MKLSRLHSLYYIGERLIDRCYVGQVVEQTGWWMFTKFRVREVHRPYGGYWYFAENGEFTPHDDVEKLERAWIAKNGEPSELPNKEDWPYMLRESA